METLDRKYIKLAALARSEAEQGLDLYRDAACKGADIDDVFPERGKSPNKIFESCLECPVINSCLREAIQSEGSHKSDIHGVYGGLSAPDRKRLVELNSPDKVNQAIDRIRTNRARRLGIEICSSAQLSA